MKLASERIQRIQASASVARKLSSWVTARDCGSRGDAQRSPTSARRPRPSFAPCWWSMPAKRWSIGPPRRLRSESEQPVGRLDRLLIDIERVPRSLAPREPDGLQEGCVCEHEGLGEPLDDHPTFCAPSGNRSPSLASPVRFRIARLVLSTLCRFRCGARSAPPR